ncbi:branched-chain amino acid ABC transporter permease [Thermus thermophilus]|uniref:branched-chain amino acid ABC transporter permease n=1 Tax=Thermus thermophilus TaxID=274 RepID=UPI0011657896|nr:branched-chain amino acid ABC transporter permease [Thermus thermophilus]BBL82583.1 branched-chain amino acid ABC transporter permease [Thermus thermophilus]BBL84883.1 branched-chain amino acid ABC transporter permease [Thermus thermophilus]BCZ89614.1 branched-chain amino acid ABC transporter permease [Thermus thermophilus]BCZ92261.1 branched-chain amino acid ABC transporter permease [Thermus thermophilus]BCZ94795.1 branched-chain amino acid ABC transporter permease [Thermus thermophilus]
MSLLSLALSLVFLVLSFLAPNTLSAFLGLGALGVAAFARLEPRVRTLNLALLTLAFTLFLRNSGNTLGLIGLVGILVALTTLPRIPRGIRVVLGLAILLLSVPIAGFANTFIFELGIQIGIFAAMSLGLNVVVGMAGLLDLGYAAFFAVGAYTWAIFGSPQAGKFLQGNFPLPGEYMYLFMFIAVVTTAITGLLIGLPALRLRGDYLAIVTLGLGEVVRILANNLDHPINITNGPQGITPVGRPPIDWFRSLMGALGVRLDETTDYQLFFYLLVLVMIGLVVLANVNLANSRFGRAWVAIREDEIAAQAMGIPLLPTKLIAFMTGAAFSGVMGVIYGAQRTFVSPESFTLLASITILAMVILGGMGSIPGAILGAAALTILNLDILKTFSEFVRTSLPWIPSQVDPAKYERLVFGLILVLMMIYRPQGLIPEARHRAELEEEA